MGYNNHERHTIYQLSKYSFLRWDQHDTWLLYRTLKSFNFAGNTGPEVIKPFSDSMLSFSHGFFLSIIYTRIFFSQLINFYNKILYYVTKFHLNCLSDINYSCDPIITIITSTTVCGSKAKYYFKVLAFKIKLTPMQI